MKKLFLLVATASFLAGCDTRPDALRHPLTAEEVPTSAYAMETCAALAQDDLAAGDKIAKWKTKRISARKRSMIEHEMGKSEAIRRTQAEKGCPTR
ncbi:hypothetical protein [Acetobacter sp.]|uniref:hypothetical protein n=1 Tax=Acetobacter sp. TaxID=440 RepID=UPI0039EB3C6F